MKLSRFTHLYDYVFSLDFANGETIESNLADLIGNHVDLQNLNTARIDPDWGCLEFSSGMQWIVPTLRAIVINPRWGDISAVES